MSEPVVLGITGPAGGGKSTVAALLARQWPLSADIEVDKVKHFIVTGFCYDDSEQGVAQWRLLGDNLGLLAANLRSAGYSVIVNGYLNETAWRAMARHISFDCRILLLPSLDVTVRRDLGRNEDDQMGVEAIREDFDYLTGVPFFRDFTRLDSSTLAIDETVEQIKTLLAAG